MAPRPILGVALSEIPEKLKMGYIDQMISGNFSQVPQFYLHNLFVHLDYFPLTSRNLRHLSEV